MSVTMYGFVTLWKLVSCAHVVYCELWVILWNLLKETIFIICTLLMVHGHNLSINFMHVAVFQDCFFLSFFFFCICQHSGWPFVNKLSNIHIDYWSQKHILVHLTIDLLWFRCKLTVKIVGDFWFWPLLLVYMYH